MNDAVNGQAQMTLNSRTYHGSRYCGPVKMTVSGEPVGIGYSQR